MPLGLGWSTCIHVKIVPSCGWVCGFRQGLVVQRMDNNIHQINRYPVDSIVGFVNTYPLDSVYPVEQPAPAGLVVPWWACTQPPFATMVLVVINYNVNNLFGKLLTFLKLSSRTLFSSANLLHESATLLATFLECSVTY